MPIPGLETLIGSALGGAFRLGQAWLETREKQRDRDHEFRMTELQGQQAFAAAEARLREVGLQGEIAVTGQEIAALVDGIKSQAFEARSAGGWVAALSATVRPLTTYALLGYYGAIKAALIAAAWTTDGAVASIAASWSEGDMAILSSILSFWFVDRSLRHAQAGPVRG